MPDLLYMTTYVLQAKHATHQGARQRTSPAPVGGGMADFGWGFLNAYLGKTSNIRFVRAK
jgi:hypothetical protein